MMQIMILLILSIVLAALVIFLIVCYSDYRHLQKENDDYDRLFKDQFRLHSDSLETYEAMMREAGHYWKSDEEESLQKLIMLNFLFGVALRFNTDKTTPAKRKENSMEKNNNKTEHNAGTARRYKTILADPPWQKNQTGVRGASRHYELMPLERIKTMPIADLADENAHPYLWTPNNIIPEALQVVKAWGFTYRNMLVWGKPKLGLGIYIRTSHESCIFATRGKAPVKFHAQPSFMFCAQQDHSHKPEEQFAIIQRLSDGPYLELFARRRMPGWDVWGNEIDSDIIMPGDYPVPKYSAKALGEEG